MKYRDYYPLYRNIYKKKITWNVTFLSQLQERAMHHYAKTYSCEPLE